MLVTFPSGVASIGSTMRKIAPPVHTAIDGDSAAIGLDRPFGNGESETRSTIVPRPRFIEAKEAIEDPHAMLGSDSRSSVGKR